MYSTLINKLSTRWNACILLLFASLYDSSAQTIQTDTAYISRMIKKSVAIADNKPDSALIYIDSLINLAKFKNYTEWLGKCYNANGIVHYVKGQYSEAFDNYEEALRHYTRTGSSLGLSQVYANKAIIFSKTGYYDRATSLFLDALRLADENNFIALQGTIHNSLGVLELRQENYNAATHHYLESIKISKSQNNARELAGTYGNLANVYLAKKVYDSAIFYNQNHGTILIR